MRKIRCLNGCVAGKFLTAMIWLLALFICGLNACAGNHVVAWGAGMTFNPSDNIDFGQSIVPTDLTNPVQVAGGWLHSLALKADGTLEGWGTNISGDIDFPDTSNYIAIACGYVHSAALRADGTVAVAGDFYFGQLDEPADLSNVVAISCGFFHTLALKADGTVAAWGGEGAVDYGQGTVPSGVSNVVEIAAGGYHNLVLKSDGSLFAWGDDEYGEAEIPSGLSNVVAIAAGSAHNLVLKANGTVAAWGADDYGQTDVPSNLSNVVAIAAGGWHSLALKSDGTVAAWGAGIGTNSEDYGQDIVPANLTNGTQIAIQIAAGTVNSLALVGTAPPVTRAVSVQPGLDTNGFSLWLPTRNGLTYQLEFKNSLTDNLWQARPLQPGTGGVTRFTDSSTVAAPQRFYRVLQW
jgi:Regulator of chromosome condensation (RCC1) repeat